MRIHPIWILFFGRNSPPKKTHIPYQVIQSVTFSSPIVGGYLTIEKGHVFTIPKRVTLNHQVRIRLYVQRVHFVDLPECKKPPTRQLVTFWSFLFEVHLGPKAYFWYAKKNVTWLPTRHSQKKTSLRLSDWKICKKRGGLDVWMSFFRPGFGSCQLFWVDPMILS